MYRNVELVAFNNRTSDRGSLNYCPESGKCMAYIILYCSEFYTSHTYTSSFSFFLLYGVTRAHTYILEVALGSLMRP